MHLCLGTTPTVQQTMLFQHVRPDEVHRAVEVRRSAAGKPTNVARVLHTLGEQALLCIPVGGDTGAFIRQDLDVAGIAHDCVESAAPTRTCVTLIDRGQGTATELVEEPGPLSIAETVQMLEKLKIHVRESQVVILSGTLARGVRSDFYADCCRLANDAGVKVILDARGEPLTQALSMRPLVVKPNRQELATMLGKPIDDDATLREAMLELHRRGAPWVVITMGKAGAVASDGKSFWKIPAIKVDAVSAVGSGDAFAAGLAAGIAAGRDVPEAFRLAAACAAANTLIPGAGILRIEDIRALRPLAELQRGFA